MPKRASAGRRDDIHATMARAGARTAAYLRSDAFAAREDAQETLQRVELLAWINERGFVTIDSQEGGDYGTYVERPDLAGFVARAHADAFVEALNRGNVVAFRVMESEAPASRITVTRKGKKAFTHIPTALDRATLRALRRNAFLPEDAAADLVAVIDPTYGARAHELYASVTDAIHAVLKKYYKN